MIRYYTTNEIALMWRKSKGTIRWLAHRDKWRRSGDGRRPVLYYTEDVESSMSKST